MTSQYLTTSVNPNPSLLKQADWGVFVEDSYMNWWIQKIHTLIEKKSCFWTEFGRFDTKSFRCKSIRYKLKLFRDIIKVDSIQLNIYVLNCLVVRPAQKLQSRWANEDDSKRPQLWKYFQCEILFRGGQKLLKSLKSKLVKNWWIQEIHVFELKIETISV